MATTSTTGGASALPAAGGISESTLSNWAGPYVTNMLGKAQAIADTPYQTYQGPMTAGESNLQANAFKGLGSLTVPSGIGSAATTAGDIASRGQNMSYTPIQATNQFTAPAQSMATNFTNQFTAPSAYQNTAFTSGVFGNDQTQQYMNPYLQQSLNPQLAEARRQADITAQQNNAQMAKAGAFGGGRQAILTAENQRNLGTRLSDITGQGYNTAFTNAMSQYNQDQARNLQAQQAAEQSKQFGASQGMTAAQMMAQYGLSAQQAQEAARQFNQSQSMAGAQSAAQYGLAGQQANIGQQQFGANLGLQGLQLANQAAQNQGSLSNMQNQVGLSNLNAQLAGGAQQRGIEQEGVTADYNDFLTQRDYPMKQTQYLQSMLQGLPYQTVTNSPLPQSGIGQLASTIGGLTNLDDALSKFKLT
jgi:hypothetical protein